MGHLTAVIRGGFSGAKAVRLRLKTSQEERRVCFLVRGLQME